MYLRNLAIPQVLEFMQHLQQGAVSFYESDKKREKDQVWMGAVLKGK